MVDSDRFRMEIRELGRGHVIDLAGDLSSPYSDQLLHKLEAFLAEQKNDLILNLRDVEYISDEAIGQLKWALEQLRSRGGDLKIINIGPVIKNRFDTLGVSEAFNIHLPVRFWHRDRIVELLRRMGIYFSRRTGLRMSTFVLILLLVAIIGWYLSLRGLIRLQSQQLVDLNSQITSLQNQIFALKSERSRFLRQIDEMREKLIPLEAIGFFTFSSQEEEPDSGKVLAITLPGCLLEKVLLPGGDVLDSLSVGDSVTVVSRQWIRIKIRTSDGLEGWISEDALVEPSDTIP